MINQLQLGKKVSFRFTICHLLHMSWLKSTGRRQVRFTRYLVHSEAYWITIQSTVLKERAESATVWDSPPLIYYGLPPLILFSANQSSVPSFPTACNRKNRVLQEHWPYNSFLLFINLQVWDLFEKAWNNSTRSCHQSDYLRRSSLSDWV